ncbi:MAG TPA: hypothetical protein VMZ11_05340 [Mycobacteriales bacterium]|nr:hypothetical protein [Mycobacteriales bacterium]
MEHVVFFPAHDGSPAFRRLATLDDAVRFVEHLRNTEGVDQFSVHALTEVPLAFKAYYRVEVPLDGEVPAPAPSAPLAVAPVAAPVAEEPTAPSVPEQEQAADAEPVPSSLGFFTR